MRASYPELDIHEVTLFGGGAKSALWNQIRADVLGLPHVLLAREDLGPLGNAILAGYALGIYDDMAEAAERFVERTATIEPRPHVHAYYRQCADFYGRLLAQTEPALADLGQLQAWED